MRRTAIASALLASLPLAFAFAAEPREPFDGKFFAPKGYVCHRARVPIQIDGKLDDAAWTDAPWTDDFVDIEGDAKPKPRFRTRAKMLWDDQFFYVAAELEEPHVWGTLTEHDSVIFQDNDFEVFIDPDGDSHNYSEFEINALNTGWDLLLTKSYKDGGLALNGWDIAGLKTAVHIDGTLNDPSDADRGWTVELAFPWKALSQLTRRPGSPKEGEHWRVNFSRVEWKHEIVDGKYRKVPKGKEDNWVWSPQGVIDMHRPEKWGYVLFTTGAPGTVTFPTMHSEGPRHILHRVYYAQRAFQLKHGRYGSLRELEKFFDFSLKMEVTENGFEASAESKLGGRWHIREDARIWQPKP